MPCCDNNDVVVEEANAWTTTVVGHIASSNRLLSGDVFMVLLRLYVLEGQADV